MAGGKGVDGVRELYKYSFLDNMPDDMTLVLISRTVGVDQVIDETILKFTHIIDMSIFIGIRARSWHSLS